MKCHKCGKILTEEDDFCPECGNKVNRIATTSSQKKNKKIALRVVVVTIIVIIVIGLFIVFICDKGEIIEKETPKYMKEEGCDDECSSDRCFSFDYIECSMKSDGCRDEKSIGKVKGKCGVECTIDNDCSQNEGCVNYECTTVEYKSSCEGNDLIICLKTPLKVTQGNTFTVNLRSSVTVGGTWFLAYDLSLSGGCVRKENNQTTIKDFMQGAEKGEQSKEYYMLAQSSGSCSVKVSYQYSGESINSLERTILVQ